MAHTLTLVEDSTAANAPHFLDAAQTSPSIFGRRRGPWMVEVDVRMASRIDANTPTVEQLLQMIQPSACAVGNEFALELALREALNNAVVHGNQMDPSKLIEIHCRCDEHKGVWLIVRDRGNGFDPDAVPDPVGPQGLKAEHGRGIYLMKLLMDEVSFERGGSEVHMWKAPQPHSAGELHSSHKHKESQHVVQLCG